MKLLSFDIEISDIFELGKDEDILNPTPRSPAEPLCFDPVGRVCYFDMSQGYGHAVGRSVELNGGGLWRLWIKSL